jgi:transposase
MGAAVPITRLDQTASDPRSFAGKCGDGAWVRRLLAIAQHLDGRSRAEAAELNGMDRQTLSDWVHRYNAAGMDGLKSRLPPGGAGYRQAASDGRPEAIQVAHRWHLMENASAAFLTAVQRSMQAIRKAVGVGVVDPALLTSAELRQHDGWLRREKENAAVLDLAAGGTTIKEIVRRTGRSRGLVRQIIRTGRADIFRTRMSSLEPFLTRLDKEWTDGCHNGAALWRNLKTAGFVGSHRVVTEWATRRRKEEVTPSDDNRPRKSPSARVIARMMTVERDKLSKTVARTIAIIEGAVSRLTAARDLIDRFHDLIRGRASADLEAWLAAAKPSLVASFAKGIVQDHAAVKAALTEPWSNGQTEGQNTKLKLVKRQMYGRAGLDLLRARLLGAP